MADHSPQRQDSQDSASPKGVGGRKSSKMPGYVSRCFDTEAGLSGSDSSDEDDASGSDISRLFADSDGDESDGSCCARLAFGPGSPMAGGSEWPVGRTGGGTPIVPVTGPGLPGRDSAQGLGTCAGPLDAVASVEAGAQAAKPSKRKRAPKKPRTGGLRQPAPVGNPLPVADAASVDNRRARHWLFTVNNYADSDIDQLKVLGLSSQVGYLCWQREIGGGAGVPHLQGYVSFKESVPLRTVKTRVGNRAHLLMANGSAEDNIAYCSKSDTRDETDPSYCFVECGTRPRPGVGTQGGRSDVKEIALLVQAGSNERAIFDAYGGAYIRNHRGISAALALCQKKRDFKTIVVWLYGDTGSGKSRFAHNRVSYANSRLF